MAQTNDNDYFYEAGTLNEQLNDYQVYQDNGNLHFHDQSNGEVYRVVGGTGLDLPAGRSLQVGGTSVVGAQQQSYTISNHTEDTALDEANDTTSGVANVLGTLIQDLQTHGLIG